MYAGGNAGGVHKITAPELRARKVHAGHHGAVEHGAEAAQPIAMVTAYDFTMARLLDEAGVDMMLVGDSLGMVVQGHANTLPVTLEEMAYHTRAVVRGAARAHVVADMPFMSYQVSPAQAVESAGRLVKEGGAESVKLEGGVDFAEHTRRIVRAGIPVVGHVGLTPQAVHALGGFKVQGRGDDAVRRLLDDATALEEAGVFALVLEAIPPDVAAAITARVSVPTIGIGAGAACDGQVLVCTDLLGMMRGRSPKFAKRFAELGDAIVEATRTYVSEVRGGAFPSAEHTYKANGARPVAAAPPSSSTRLGVARADDSGTELDAPLALDQWH